MKTLKALKSFVVSSTGEFVRPGLTFTVAPRIAADYARRGMAKVVEGETPVTIPFGTTGQTGRIVPSSSSLVAPAPPRSNSTARAGNPESSPLMKDTGSARGQTSSTPATARGGSKSEASKDSLV